MAIEPTKVAGKKDLAKEIATRTTDPHYYAALGFLPNPDEILRKLGRDQEVYAAIMMDAHVMGDLRSIRSGLLSYEWQLVPGGKSRADKRAFELCQEVFKRKPAPGMKWSDVIWSVGKAVLTGYAVHEVVWLREGAYMLPQKVIDRPGRRFRFGLDNQLRLITRENQVEGDEVAPYKFLVSRHMPSFDNPYGVAALSACFWPYTFKHAGFRFFAKFCEKYGLPWALGKYPEGTTPEQITALANALADLVEDGIAAVPDNGKVELLTVSASGQLVQDRLIEVCNKEMSKALTSQTLSTEIQGQGSRAASETHRGKEMDINEADREIVCDSLSELCAWITEINIPGAEPPTFEFYEEEEARKEWVEVFEGARNFIQIPKQFAHDRLQIPQPAEGEEVLPAGNSKPVIPQDDAPEFSKRCPGCGQVHDFRADIGLQDPLANQAANEADALLESIADEVKQLLEESETLEEFRDKLVALQPGISDSRLGEMTSLALMTGMLQGMDEA